MIVVQHGVHTLVLDPLELNMGLSTHVLDTMHGTPAAGMAVQLATGANALATAEGVKARMAELARGFPPDITWAVPFDTTNPLNPINRRISIVVMTKEAEDAALNRNQGMPVPVPAPTAAAPPPVAAKPGG